MTRSASIYSSGSIPFAGGGGNRKAFFDQVITTIRGPQSNGVDAWEPFCGEFRGAVISDQGGGVCRVTFPGKVCGPAMIGLTCYLDGWLNGGNNSFSGGAQNVDAPFEIDDAGDDWVEFVNNSVVNESNTTATIAITLPIAITSFTAGGQIVAATNTFASRHGGVLQSTAELATHSAEVVVYNANATNRGVHQITAVSGSPYTTIDAAGIILEVPVGATFQIIMPNSTRDIVMRSRGDRTLGTGQRTGDARLFWHYRLHNDSTFYSDAYADISQTFRQGATNPGSAVLCASQTSGGGTQVLSDTALINWWAVCDSHQFVFIAKQGGDYFILLGGQSTPTHISTARRGIFYATASKASGAGSVAVDRDTTVNPIIANTVVHIVNATPDLEVLRSAAFLPRNATVTAVAAMSLTFSVSTALDDLAFIGQDCIRCCYALYNQGALPNFGQAAPNFTDRSDGTNVLNNNRAQLEHYTPGITQETDVDPDTWNVYEGTEFQFRMVDGATTARGGMPLAAAWPIGTQVDLDRMLPDDDVAKAHKFFVSIQTSVVGYGTGFGPGAT